MFKIPEWEEDIPKTKINLVKKVKAKASIEKCPSESLVSKSFKLKKNDKNKLKPILALTPKTPIIEKTAKKRKIEKKDVNKKKIYEFNDSLDTKPHNSNKVKKQKLTIDPNQNVSINIVTPKTHSKINKNLSNRNVVKEALQTKLPNNHKKEKLKKLLDQNRATINSANKSSALRNRMMERLKAAQFRYLNEKLYTSSGLEAQKLFQADPTAFHTYHEGYQQQVKKWPVNPLDVIVKRISKMPKSHVIADMGCGEAALSQRVPHAVRSFDLVSAAPGVEVCDMAHTPLLAASVDAVVYCLALMGTELTQYLLEANRILKQGGHLLIAEVESRFDNPEAFTREVEKLGFKLKSLDKTHQVFFFLQFVKVRDSPVKKSKLPTISLKPCLYKKR